MQMSDNQRADIQPFLLHESSYQRNPCHCQHRRFVCKISADVIITGIIPLRTEQFELSTPIIIPASRNVIVMEICLIYKIPMIAFPRIEAATYSK